VTILWRGEVAARVPARALAEDTPVYVRSLPDTPEYVQTAWAWSEAALADRPLPAPQTAWQRLLQNPSIASKAWIYRQYDSQVQNNTVLGPGGEAAVIRLRPQPTAIGVELPPAPPPSLVGLAATVDANGRYVYLDPYEGAKLAVAEAARNLSCVGALPLAVTDNLNFASPEKPVGYWQLHEACRGIAEACRELDTPVTGGNVSLYNEKLDGEGNAQPIYPTPVIGMVGLVEDVRQTVGGRWQPGDTVYVVGGDRRTLGASEYLAWVLGEVTGRPVPVDFAEERAVQALCREAIVQGWATGARDRSEGGVAILLAEFAIASGVGATVHLPAAVSAVALAQQLFGEGPGCIVLAIGAAHCDNWEKHLATQAVSWQRLGEVGGDSLTVVCGTATTLQAPVAELRERYEGVLPGYLGD
ncbi:MAG TPA: phosphoribosylformylglycinamidine synthase II, partial [Cyanobacteria bacterium UBA8156]|nr:phosphoribosylformylglycinamidine synthase II [Cyanobacteria bacterium UBA8156]